MCIYIRSFLLFQPQHTIKLFFSSLRLCVEIVGMVSPALNLGSLNIQWLEIVPRLQERHGFVHEFILVPNEIIGVSP